MTDMEAIYRDALTTRLLRRMSHALQHDLKSPVQGIYWSLELALSARSLVGKADHNSLSVSTASVWAQVDGRSSINVESVTMTGGDTSSRMKARRSTGYSGSSGM